MLNNSKISEDEVEVIAEAVARRSWWKNPALYIPVITAVLGSPVVLTLLPAKVQPAEAKTEFQQIVPEPDRTRYNGQGDRRWDKPKPATVIKASALRKWPDPKTDATVQLAAGTKILYYSCRQATKTTDETNGQWCKGTYIDKAGKSHSGWVFAAHLQPDMEES